MPKRAANAMHPAPTAIPAMAPTASPLCGAAIVVLGLTDADALDAEVVDAPESVGDSVVVDAKADDEYSCSTIVLPIAVI